MRPPLLIAACALTVTANSVLGQTAGGVFAGRVTANGAPLANVQISATSSPDGPRAVTDSAGRFQITGLPVGLQTMEFRRIGFAVLQDTVTISDNATVERDIVMLAQSTNLDTVRTQAAPDVLSPRLRGFEERRTNPANGGRFMSSAELRELKLVSLTSALRRTIPGAHIVNYRGGEYLYGSRGGGNSSSSLDRTDPHSPRECWVAVYLDGAVMYDGPPAAPPDLRRFAIENLAGIEYYASSASTPLQFKSMKNDCGTLLLWTRAR